MKLNYESVITGEKIQKLCHIYAGTQADFTCLPSITGEIYKHLDLTQLESEYNNPRLIFCKTSTLPLLAKKIHFFKNKLTLVSHNSDELIYGKESDIVLLNNPNIEVWFAQNICMTHSKLRFLPIGIHNSQWPGGTRHFYDKDYNISKVNKVYFYFDVETSPNARRYCYERLKDKLTWLDQVSPEENLKRLASYEFAICPEGNGVDTHRVWECLLLKTVPIVMPSGFTDILKENNIPLLEVDKDWNLDLTKLEYNNFNFNNVPTFESITKSILDTTS